MTLPPPLDWQADGIGPGLDILPERRVTRENWRLYPYSRWALQHTRELVPSRPIRASNAPLTLAEEPVDFGGLRFDDGTGRTINWADFARETYANALLVLHRGRIAHQSYYNGMTPHMPHHLFSVTKSFVGLVAEILIGEAVLHPQAPVTRYVPELAASGFAEARVRHLLDMTDGVAFDEDYANPDADVHTYSAAYWTPASANGGAHAALARLTRSTAKPGEHFAYRTPVADALGWVIARASGRRLADLVSDHLWQPAGCVDGGHFLVDVDGDEIAASGINATPHDLARLALFLLEPASPLNTIRNAADRALAANPDYTARSVHSYRSQWWLGDDFATGMGVYGQRFHLEPEKEFAFIRLGSHPLASNQITDVLHSNAIAALRRSLGINA